MKTITLEELIKELRMKRSGSFAWTAGRTLDRLIKTGVLEKNMMIEVSTRTDEK